MLGIKRKLLHSLLLAAFTVVPVAGFGMYPYSDTPSEDKTLPQKSKPQSPQMNPEEESEAAAMSQEVYWGRPYYYRPYHYYYPYRPYYNRYYHYPYRPYYYNYYWY